MSLFSYDKVVSSAEGLEKLGELLFAYPGDVIALCPSRPPGVPGNALARSHHVNDSERDRSTYGSVSITCSGNNDLGLILTV